MISLQTCSYSSSEKENAPNVQVQQLHIKTELGNEITNVSNNKGLHK